MAADRGTPPPTPPSGRGSGYAYDQLVRAFLTAVGHDDPAVRTSADRRATGWRAVLAGIADGRLTIGSRRPVADLPAWATTEVLRGGFATGRAHASGGAGRERFERALTEAGLTHLNERLVAGDYAVRVPEHAALLTVAWLIGAGDLAGAERVLEAIAPYADRLDFTPAPRYRDRPAPVVTTSPADDATIAPDQPVVWRASAGEVREHLAARTPRRAPTAQREALLVWNPFADEVLALWLRTCAEGDDAATVGTRIDDAWRADARAILERYDALAAAHPLCSKHCRPKENLAILLAALRDAVAGAPPDPRSAGLLQVAVRAMVARRGAPGTTRHAALRALQRTEAAATPPHAIARIAAQRLAAFPPDGGMAARDLVPALAPVTPGEADAYNNDLDAVRDGGAVRAGMPVTRAVEHVIRSARAGTLATLISTRAVTSAEGLAELVPRVAATTLAAAYADAPLRRLMAANYLAFRARRSVLLVELQSQVGIGELPWVAAVARHRRDGAAGAAAQDDARRALVDLIGLTLRAFPATIVPSALVTELAALAGAAGLSLRLVPELAADIFQGLFAPRFLAAAQLAAGRLDGTLYARYYDIDYPAIAAIDDLAPAYDGGGPVTSRTFDALCRARAGQHTQPGFPGVAGRGGMIEQAQILTTHNLASLTDAASLGGDEPDVDHAVAAHAAFRHAGELGRRLGDDDRSLRVVKNLAYAWRQAVFFAALAPDPAGVVADAARDAELLAPAYEQLQRAARGKAVDPDRRVLGWTAGERHWLLVAAGRSE